MVEQSLQERDGSIYPAALMGWGLVHGKRQELLQDFGQIPTQKQGCPVDFSDVASGISQAAPTPEAFVGRTLR